MRYPGKKYPVTAIRGLSGMERFHFVQDKILKEIFQHERCGLTHLSLSIGLSSTGLYGLKRYTEGHDTSSNVWRAFSSLVEDGFIQEVKKGKRVFYIAGKHFPYEQFEPKKEQEIVDNNPATLLKVAAKQAQEAMQNLQEKVVTLAKIECQEEIAALRKELAEAKAEVLAHKKMMEEQREEGFVKKFFDFSNSR